CVLHSSPSCCSAVAHRALPSFPTRRSSDLAGLSAGPSRTSTRSCGEPCFHCKKASVHRKTPTNSPVCAILKKGRLSKRKQKAQKDRKSTRLNSSHVSISYAVFCLKKKNIQD